MKVKTSIERSRSKFIEKAVWYYLDILKRDTRDRIDLDIINASVSRLNDEANDVLGFQAQI